MNQIQEVTRLRRRLNKAKRRIVAGKIERTEKLGKRNEVEVLDRLSSRLAILLGRDQ